MKIGDKVIAIEGFAGLDFSYGMGDESNPATYIEVTEANIGHLSEAEGIGRIKVVKSNTESSEPPPEETEKRTKKTKKSKE